MSPRTVVCVLEIFYAVDKTAHLTVYSDSSPTSMASSFAREHSLTRRYQKALEQHIRENLRNVPSPDRSVGSEGTGNQSEVQHVVPRTSGTIKEETG